VAAAASHSGVLPQHLSLLRNARTGVGAAAAGAGVGAGEILAGAGGWGEGEAEAAGEAVEAAAGGQGGAGGDDRHLGVEGAGQDGADVDDGQVQLWAVPELLHPGHLVGVGGGVEEADDVGGQAVDQTSGLGDLGPGGVAGGSQAA
jgi:hypothetical protein